MLVNNFALITVTNPFDPTQQIRTSPMLLPNTTVSAFVPESIHSIVVGVNGVIIDEENYSTHLIKPSDTVVVLPVPQGGGGSKNVFRMIAMIALAAFAPHIAVGMLGQSLAATTIIGGLTYGGLLTAGITMVGGMLINAILPPNVPKAKNYNQDLEESPSYGIDGAKNTSTEDTVVPVVYGRYRIGGNRIAAFVKNVGNTQDAYMLFNAGEGPIAGISGVEINGQPVENFDDVEYRQRTGTATQGPIGWFGDGVVPFTLNSTITDSFTNYTTTGLVDKFRFDVTAPGGIAFYNDEGGVDKVTVNLTIQYRKQGNATWINMPDVNYRLSKVTRYYYNDTETLETSLRAGDVLAGYQNKTIFDVDGEIVGTVQDASTYSTSHSIHGSGRQPIRRSYESPELEQAVYELRIKRNNAESVSSTKVDGITLSEVNEITTEAIGYRHTALLGMRIRLTDQLNSLPAVNYIHHGTRIKIRRIVGNVEVWSYSASSNPAWVAYDILTNQRYGARIAESRINIARWQEWADYCDSEGLEFNGVFDTQNNAWDTLMHVFRAGHAQIINQGTRYSVGIERADSPVMMFNSSNIVEKSLNISWMPRSERANEVEIAFWNRDDGYKRSMVKVRDPALQPNDQVRAARITLFGVTNPDVAIKEAIFQINLNKHILRTVEFDTTLDALACTIGDQILLQHEMPNWGDGGRIASGSTGTVIELDRGVTVLSGRSYKILAIFDKLSRVTGTVGSIVSNIVWLNGFDGRTDVKRIIINGTDYEIERVVNDGIGGYGVEINDTSAVLALQSYEIFDTDVIEERNVTTGVGDHSQITVDAAFSQAPQFGVKWMFGEVGIVKRPFRILSISGTHEYERTISAIEYVEEVYDLSNSEIIPTVESTINISHVTDLTQDNTWTKVGNLYQPVASLGWGIPQQGYYGGALIYMSKNGADFVRVGEAGARETNFDYFGLSVGDTAIFKVVAQDIIFQKATYNTAPTVNYTAIARPETGVPAGLFVTTRDGNYVLSWTNPIESFSGIEIWRGTVDDVAFATKVDEVTGQAYTDSSAPLNTIVYYWVRTTNADGITGDWNAANGSTTTPPGQVSNLVQVGSFDGLSATVEWDELAEAKDYIVEIYANAVLSRSLVVVDTTFTYSIDDATNDNNIDRAITFTVKPRLISNQAGAANSIIVTNAQIPTPPASLVLGTTGTQITVNFDKRAEKDVGGYKVWASTTNGFTPGPLNLVYDGPNNGFIMEVTPGETWYAVVGAYDVWGEDSIALSGQQSILATTGAAIASQLSGEIDRSHLAAALNTELDTLDSEYVVKVEDRTSDGKQYIAGFGVAVSGGGSGPLTSSFLVKADTFAVIPSDTAGTAGETAPFIVSGNVVYMNAAFIQDASITNAKIGNIIQSDNYTPTTGWKIDKSGLAEFQGITIRDNAGNIILSSGSGYTGNIDSSQVDNLAAMATIDQITTTNVSTYIQAAAIGSAQIGSAAILSANIGNAQINTAHIGDAQITNAKIGSVIQSNNYSPGTTGWKIDKTGTAEFSQVTIRDDLGNIIFDSGTGLNVDISDVAGLGSIASINQITAANIGTYMGTAAIKNAYIGNAEVDTLKIAGRAVTNPVSAYTAANYQAPTRGSWATAQTVTITSSGEPILVSFSGIFYANWNNEYDSTGDKVDVRVRCSTTGAILWHFSEGSNINDTHGPMAASVTYTPGSGTYTFVLEIKYLTEYHCSMQNRSLVLMEVKR